MPRCSTRLSPLPSGFAREKARRREVCPAGGGVFCGVSTSRQQALWGWRQLPVPVIAAIQGVAFGGGFQLALGANMRFLAPYARMSIMEIKWGLGADMAGGPVRAY